MPRKIEQVGFVGLGNMGLPMAARLVAGGYSVIAFDTDERRVTDFAKAGKGRGALSLKELAAESDAVITMLPNSEIVNRVVDGPNGLRSGFKKESILIEMSSGAPGMTKGLAEGLSKDGVHLVDAPVSGGVGKAKTGELSIMLGADDAIAALITPVLQTMGTNILRTGAIGSAHAMKALNNLVSAGGFLIGIEALLIGKQFGLNPDAMVDILNASTGMNNSTQKKFKQFVLSGLFNSGFGLDLMVKDISIAIDLGKQVQANTPFACLLRELSASAAALLGPGQDHTSLAQFAEKLAGVSLSDSPRK